MLFEGSVFYNKEKLEPVLFLYFIGSVLHCTVLQTI